MTNNGIVLPDLTLKPVALEVKQIYCPIIFEDINSDDPWVIDGEFGKFVIKNRNMFLDTSLYQVIYLIREDGKVIKTGMFKPPYLKAGEEVKSEFSVDFDKKFGSEYHVDFSVKYAKNTAFAKAGYELGVYQFRLDNNAKEEEIKLENAKDNTVKQKIKIEEEENFLTLISTDSTITFDKATGIISSCKKNDLEYLKSGPLECMTRPYTGIDAQEGWGRYVIWNVFDSDNIISTLKDFKAEIIGETKAYISTEREVKFKNNPFKAMVLTSYMVFAEGKIEISTIFKIDPCLKDLPRVGVELIIPEGFEELEYFGLGPSENYRDRKNCATLGVFKNTVENEHFPFIPPSENGGHEETRWLTLVNDTGMKIKIDSHIPFHFDVHHNSIDDYKDAKHEHELIRRKECYLHIEAVHSGIGSDMGWSTVLMESEWVKAQNYSMDFTISFE